jgi:stearoyl-CoA desaturase (Delta-9 desaturase)
MTFAEMSDLPRGTLPVQRQLNWRNIGFLLASPIAAVAGIGTYVHEQGVRPVDLTCFFSMMLLTGLAITAGYHRYYSHRTYECHPVLQAFFLLFGAAALQAPVLTWASEHRDHHRFVDGDADPYCIKKGFFWAHMGWIFYRADPPRTLANVVDLRRNALVRAQYRYHLPLGLAVGLGIPFLLGLTFDRPWGGVLWGGLLRVVVAHHGTFLVNSAGHFFGRQPYSEHNSSRDSAILAMLTLGEGYHNYHHAFPGDYRNGARWYQWDPTKWWIFGLRAVGLAWQLKRTPQGYACQARLKGLAGRTSALDRR